MIYSDAIDHASDRGNLAGHEQVELVDEVVEMLEHRVRMVLNACRFHVNAAGV